MSSLENLQEEIDALKARNRKVEADKAWEVSGARRASVAGLTYLVVVLFFVTAGLPHPFVNAIVPSMGFVLSTLSLSLFKKWWINSNSKKSGR